MKIVIGNQKGGVGKSTLCILLANYLAIHEKTDCLILDLDFQSSIHGLWEKDQSTYDNPPLYEVLDFDLADFQKIQPKLQQVRGHIIIDLPGKMDDNHLIPVYSLADLVVCPFSYDKICFESTMVFAQVVRHINPNANLVFVPNRLKAGVKYETMSQVNKALNHFGKVTSPLPDRVAFQRIDTLSIPMELETMLRNMFKGLFYEQPHIKDERPGY